MQPGHMGEGTIRVRLQGFPFFLTQANSGTGGITNNDCKTTATSASALILDPYNIGGRFFNFASLFTQYRIHKATLRYRPYGTAAGVEWAVAGHSTTPNYYNRAFAVGITTDPGSTCSGTSQIIAAGGIFGNTTRSWNLDIPDAATGKWLYTTTSAASPTVIDLRMTTFGYLQFAFEAASTTTTEVYGAILIDADVSFRGMLPALAPVGLSLSESDSKAMADDRYAYRLPRYDPVGPVSVMGAGAVGSRAGLSPANPPPAAEGKEQSAAKPPATFWSLGR